MGSENHGTFVWNELATGDVEKAKAFYAATLGWVWEPFDLPEGPYWVARAGDSYVAGICGFDVGPVQGGSPSWFGFIEVDDVDARVADALAKGAVIVRAPHDVPNVGREAIIRDPTGAVVGWMTSVETADE